MKKEFFDLIKKLDEQICRDTRLDRGLFARLFDKERELGLVHDDRPFCPFLRPHFVTRAQYETIALSAEVLAGAFELLATAALENNEIFAELDLTEKEERMARIDPRYERLCVSSRFDAFFDGDDYKFLEYNAETPAGVGDQMQMEKVLELVPPVKEFLAEHKHWRPAPHRRLLESLVATYRDFGGNREKPNIAIVDWHGVSTMSEFYVLQEYFESQGFPTLIADPNELEYDGDCLRVGDFAIDIFYKRILIHEFLEKFDETHPLSRAYADGRVCMANSFRSKIAHKKAGFAVLSDEQYEKLFTLECRTTFEGQEFDLPEFLRREREGFLLKPNDDYGGKGIKLGWETSQAEWETALDEALQHSYIVQERVPVGKVTIPAFSDSIRMESLLIDFDPFLFLGKAEGGLVRLSSQSLVNVSQGGGQTALVILEDF
jgi:glutathionylspermidine synthase